MSSQEVDIESSPIGATSIGSETKLAEQSDSEVMNHGGKGHEFANQPVATSDFTSLWEQWSCQLFCSRV